MPEKATKSELTLHKALTLCMMLWTWLAENPTQWKEDWPGWVKYFPLLPGLKMYAHCPICSYTGSLRIPGQMGTGHLHIEAEGQMWWYAPEWVKMV
jgi:hypothetical protein